MGIQNFPVWLRLLPKKIFQMIDRNNDLEVGPTELIAFYRDMVRIPADVAEARALDAYEQMTDGGRYTLDIDSYEMVFSNFLIGRTPFGPGRHIFGCWEHNIAHFELIMPATEEEARQSPRSGEKKGVEGDKSSIPWQKPRPRTRKL
ncbi:uncharacterized protein LOC101862273 [Aplysia californica]|uniref:Uncharacterized protein LOC101862273 n=1 Tax=Aplysia californica TaxID=6500 RepID=A0ABM1VU16_APLCA|nr:uncharacterized protein LOC101862273 [Aplysia californica]